MRYSSCSIAGGKYCNMLLLMTCLLSNIEIDLLFTAFML